MSSVVDEIKARLDIVDIVSESVKLRKAGRSYSGFCPFHSNSRTPAFAVFPESGTWRCFSCNEGGDIFAFVMKKEGMDFMTALKYLADKAGVQLEAQKPHQMERDALQERLQTLLEEAVIFFNHHLTHTSAGEEALLYLKKRGVLPETIQTFGLGYAPASWNDLINYFVPKGYKPEELVQAGLTSERQGGEGIYDRFRHRLMFPIRDITGGMAGFGARALAAEDMPKYLNSPQTPLFDKSKLLFGLNFARKSIRQLDQVVIVEGYMDMIVPYQAGFTNVVSPMGTALNEDQFRVLNRFTKRIVLALDADAAGEKATLRGLELARQALDHIPDFSDSLGGMLDVRGLLRQEKRLQADLRIASLPEGKDPDEIILENPDHWKQIIDQAKPIVVHVMDTLVASNDMNDAKVKSAVASQVIPLIEDVPDAIEREEYRQRLARLLHVDERALLQTSSRARQSGKPQLRRQRAVQTERYKPQPYQTTSDLLKNLETHCIRLLVQHPELLHSTDRFLQKCGLSRCDAVDFERSEYQIIAQSIQQSLLQDQLEPQQYLIEQIPEQMSELMQEILKPVSDGRVLAEILVEDLIRSVLRLRRLRVEQAIEQMQDFQKQAGDSAEFSPEAIHEQINRFSQVLVKLHQAINQPIQLD